MHYRCVRIFILEWPLLAADVFLLPGLAT